MQQVAASVAVLFPCANRILSTLGAPYLKFFGRRIRCGGRKVTFFACRRGQSTPLVRVADRLQAWTHEVDWRTLPAAQTDIEATNALLDSGDADAAGLILRLPSEVAGRRSGRH